jgi:DNA polymerase III alpha subunit (gram-positive type)
MKKFLQEIITSEVKKIMSEGFYENPMTTITDILDSFQDKTLIFFDTETTGLSGTKEFSQVTEIAAVAFDSQGQQLGEYHFKTELSPSVTSKINKEKQKQIQQREIEARRKEDPASNEKDVWNWKWKSIEDILDMTGYQKDTAPVVEEKEALEGFKNFVVSFSNPLLIAHNATFDMMQINNGLKRHNSGYMPKLQVLDTLQLVNNYMKPLLKILQGGSASPRVQRLIVALSFPAKDIKSLSSEEIKQKLDSIPDLEQRYKTVNKMFVSLGHLTAGFDVNLTNWHTAIADAKALSEILLELSQLMSPYEHMATRFDLPRKRAREIGYQRSKKR